MYELNLDFKKDSTQDKLFFDYIYNYFIDKDELSSVNDSYNINDSITKALRTYTISSDNLKAIFLLGFYWHVYQDSYECLDIISKSPKAKKIQKEMEKQDEAMDRIEEAYEKFLLVKNSKTKPTAKTKLKLVKKK